MSPEAITALCAGIVTIIASLGAMIVSLYNNKIIRSDARNKSEQLDQIHTLVNSRLSKALDEIAELRNHIAKLTNSAIDQKAADKANIDLKPRPLGG